nr:ras-related protein Rab-31 [Dromaius novaehollandiae]
MVKHCEVRAAYQNKRKTSKRKAVDTLCHEEEFYGGEVACKTHIPTKWGQNGTRRKRRESGSSNSASALRNYFSRLLSDTSSAACFVWLLTWDTGVGKSSIVCRFVQDHFDHNISPTIGASFMTKTVPCGNELHKFLIWDTAGQERFHSLAPMYYRGSAAAVIVYDITKQDSFHTLKKWVKELKEHGPENIVMAIAGNKCDLSDIREVPMKDAKEYADSIGAIVVETSAKNAVNIEELFQGISRQIPPLDPHENGNNGAIKLGKQTSQTGRRCC